jgi:hypothetical protein
MFFTFTFLGSSMYVCMNEMLTGAHMGLRVKCVSCVRSYPKLDLLDIF